MNKITKLSVGLILSVITLFGLFAVAPEVSAMTCNSATLSGFVVTNGNNIHARFEYGTNYNSVAAGQGTQTQTQTFTQNDFIYQLVSGLNENTTYYYRLTASDGVTVKAGTIDSFTTPACPNNNPPNNPPPNNPPPSNPPTVTFFANPSTIDLGDYSSLNWSSTNASYCDYGISGQGTTRYGTMGGINVNPSQTTTYKVTCFNSSGQSDSKSVTVTLRSPVVNAPNVTIYADQTNISFNGSTVLHWNATPSNGVACTATNGTSMWRGVRNTAGSFDTGALTSSTTFGITCSNSGGSDSDSVTVSVGQQQPTTCTNTSAINYGGPLPCQFYQAPQTCQNPNATNYGGPLPCQIPQAQVCQNPLATNYGGPLPCHVPAPQVCTNPLAPNYGGPLPCQTPTNNICTNPLATNYGGSLPCNIPNTQICTNPLATNYGGPLPCQIPQQVCNNANATNYGGPLPCQFNQQNPQPNVNITADDTSIDEGDSTTVRWSSTNATSCTATGGTNGWSGTRNTSGSFFTDDLNSDKSFGIVCRNNAGDLASDSVTINVDEDDNNNNNNDLSVDLTADDTSIRSGDSTRIRWETEDADSCEGDGGTNSWDNKNLDEDGGTFNTGSLFRTTTFSIECENDDDSDSDSVTIRVENDNNPIDSNPSASPTAITTVATQLSNTSAQLNGLFFTGGSSTNVWFEWSTSAALSNRTSTSAIGSAASVTRSDTISGLSVGVTYFYRAVAENPYGRSYGNTLSFRMQNFGSVQGTSTTVNRTTIVTGGSGRPSLVMLSIDGGSDTIVPGEKRIYHVEWKNISSQTLRKVVLRVILPQSMIFDATSKGSYTPDDNTITLDLDTLSPAEDGDMIFTAVAKPTIRGGELVVIVANLVYTDQSDVQGDAIAYATHNAIFMGSVLGANAFGAGFLPTSFLGWLFLLILLLIIALLLRHLFNQNKPKQVLIER